MSRGVVNAVCWAGLALFTLYLLRANNAYYLANTQTPTFDEAWYLETSLNLYHRLTKGGLREFIPAAIGAFEVKAPLISILPVPFYLVFGQTHRAALLANSLLLVVANVYLFLLVRRLWSAEAGLGAVVFFQTMPLAFGLSRALMAEYGLAALVIVWMYYLTASDGLTRGAANFALGVVLGLGLLMKVLFPAFVAGPLLAAWIRRRRTSDLATPEKRWLWRLCARQPAAAIVVPALVIAGPWYLRNFRRLMEFAWSSAYGEVSGEYASGGFGPWIFALVNEGISFHYLLALLMLGAAALVMQRRTLGRLATDHRSLLLAAWLVPPLVAMAVAKNHLLRFVLPVLPVCAIVLAAAIFSPDRPRIAQVLLAALVAILPLRLYANLSHYHHGAEHPVRWGPFLLSGSDLGWAHPPVWQNPWEQRRVLDALHRLAPDAEADHVIVGVEHVYLNANLLGYLNASLNYPFQFTSFGYAESSPERALERIYSLDPRFVILGEGFQNLPEFLNRINEDVRGRIERREMPFELRATAPLAHEMQARIYERAAPWAVIPQGAGEPSQRAPADFAGGVRFLGYDWQQRDRYLWEITTYWTAAQSIGEDFRVTVEFHRGAALVARQSYYLTGSRHPVQEWKPGEIVRETRTVYLGAGADPRGVEARLWLVPWGAGPAQPVVTPASPDNSIRFPLTP